MLGQFTTCGVGAKGLRDIVQLNKGVRGCVVESSQCVDR